jgi:hypothetical protein
MSESVTTYADLASSRYAVLSAPEQLPGVCSVCGTSRTDDRQYVDFGLFVEGIGAIYFCSFCIQELTNRMGSLTPDQTAKLEAKLLAAEKTILDFQRDKAALDGAISLLRDTGLFDSSDSVAVSTRLEDDYDYAREPKEDPGSPLAKSAKVTRSNSKSKQSDPKQGSDDVPAIADDELAEFGGF